MANEDITEASNCYEKIKALKYLGSLYYSLKNLKIKIYKTTTLAKKHGFLH